MTTTTRRAAAAALLATLALTLTACGPAAGGRCTEVGSIVTTDDGQQLQCRTDTDAGERLPHWHELT